LGGAANPKGEDKTLLCIRELGGRRKSSKIDKKGLINLLVK